MSGHSRARRSAPAVFLVVLACRSATAPAPASETAVESRARPAPSASASAHWLNQLVVPPPHTGGGPSCEAAADEYVRAGPHPPADKKTSANEYGAILNAGKYFKHCGVPDSTEVLICAAIHHGHAVGVSVRTRPVEPMLEECVAKAVLGLEFPANERMDVTRTMF